MMEKVVRNGKVAVIVSPGYGAGWSTWNESKICFDPIIVKWIEGGKAGAPPLDHYGKSAPYAGGLSQAEIEWIDEGTDFRVEEYDGYESIELIGDIDHFTA